MRHIAGAAGETEIAHEYAYQSCRGDMAPNGLCVITLTVTDSAGQSHSESVVMVFIDQTPD